MRQSTPDLPPLSDILKESPGWLEEAVDTIEAGRIVGFSPYTLNTWRSRGYGPPFIKAGEHSVRYQRRALLEWMAARRRRNTSDRGTSHG